MIGGTSRTSIRRLLHGETARTYSPLVSLALLLPLLAVLALIFYLPIGRLLGTSLLDRGLTIEHYQRLVDQPLYLTILLRTLRTALVVTVASLLLGYPVAYLMAQISGRLASLIAILVLLPLWTSVLVRSFAWTVILQRNGLANGLLQWLGVTSEPVKLLYTEGAVWLAMTHVLLPFMILPVYGTLRGIPPELARAARSLGAGSLATFRRVVLPLSLPGVAAGAVIVFTLSLGFFITPALVGGPTSLMLSTLIAQQATTLLNWPFAGALSMLLLVVTLALVIAFHRVLRLDRVIADGG
jgi:mannopine transport system permease protein